jgi:hypothetical protein
MPNFFDVVNFNGNEARNVRFQILATDPASPTEGQFWYNSTTKVFKYRTATATITSTDAATLNGQIDSYYLDRANHTGAQAQSTITGLVSALGNKVETSLVGAASGIAQLDSGGKVPAAQLPSYVDDVLEYANLAAFPATGASGIIYVTADTNKTYRWTGSVYAEISASPGSTDAVTEGATNLYFTVARVLATVIAGLSTATSTVITATDTVLSALGKLQAQITARVIANANITAGTNTKITYDAKGLVTAGAAATTADIAASTNRNYVTDAQAVVIGNTSGTNTGDQVVSDATLSTTDIATNNVSTVKHGFAPKLPGNTTTFLRGDGTYAAPAATGASPRYSALIGNASATTFSVTQATHGLASNGTNVPTVYDAATGEKVYPYIAVNPANGTVTVTFTGIVPAANSYRIVIL